MKVRSIAVNACRLVLGVVFAVSGFVKAVDPIGTQYKVADYLRAMIPGVDMPGAATLAAAVALSAVEFCVGVLLLFAIRRRLVSRIALAMMLLMTPLTLWLALANPISDCGCFGDAIVLTHWQTLAKNVVLLGAAVVVALWPTAMVRFISESVQWVVINYSALFVLCVEGWSLYYLPPLDFRPYSVGTDLGRLWTRTMAGEDLPYADFLIETADGGEDITERVLTDTSYVFLLVAPYLEQADDSRLDLINELYEYAREHGYGFYCLTASTPQAISRWHDTTGAEYPFCLTDDVTLKTVIRSNPGLVLLRGGVVTRKWSHNDLPTISEAQATEPLERLEAGHQPVGTMATTAARLLLWFVLPLALLSLAEGLWRWTRWVRRPRTEEQKN